MLTRIEGGRVYDPDPRGVRSVRLAGAHVGNVGDVNRRALESPGAEYEIIDASGCIVVPGLVDPHVHLLGGSGEAGFSTQTPEHFIREIVRFGITTVVGTLGRGHHDEDHARPPRHGQGAQGAWPEPLLPE